MNLKKLPQEEKPRERLLKYGKNNVSNNELIEIILKSGTKRAGIKEISHNIFTLLRKADKYNANLIIIESVKQEGLGLAIFNRLIRASGYK